MDQLRQLIRQELARLLGEGMQAPARGGEAAAWGGQGMPIKGGGAEERAALPDGGAAAWGIEGTAAQGGGVAAWAGEGATTQAKEATAAQGGEGAAIRGGTVPSRQTVPAPAGDGNLEQNYRQLTQAMSQNLQKLQFVLQETSEITRKVEQLLWEASRAEQKIKRGR